MFRRSTQQQSTDNSFNRDHALKCVPIRNPQIAEQENDEDGLCLTYQVRIKPWFQKIVQKITGKTDTVIERKLQLDTLGSSVWQMIDGQRKVIEIIDDFQRSHQLNHREAEISVTAFLKELGKRGLIIMREGKK